MNAVVRKAHEIAAKAADLVGGDRDRQHGKKRQNFENIAAMWNAYLFMSEERFSMKPLDAVDVGHMMALMKVARTQSGALNVDDYVDGAGYLACAGEVAQDYVEASDDETVDNAVQALVEGRTDLQLGDPVIAKGRHGRCMGFDRKGVRVQYDDGSGGWLDFDEVKKADDDRPLRVGDRVRCRCRLCVEGEVEQIDGEISEILPSGVVRLVGGAFIAARHTERVS